MQAVVEGTIQQLVSFLPKPGVTLLQMQLMDGAGRNIVHTGMIPLSLKYHGRPVCNLAGLSISDGTQILLAALATSGKSFHQLLHDSFSNTAQLACLAINTSLMCTPRQSSSRSACH